jgi:hypothetical protein
VTCVAITQLGQTNRLLHQDAIDQFAEPFHTVGMGQHIGFGGDCPKICAGGRFPSRVSKSARVCAGTSTRVEVIFGTSLQSPERALSIRLTR